MVIEPKTANDYDDRTTEAARSVLIEIGQVLGSYNGKFALIGGSVPPLLLPDADMGHVGTVDVDLALDPDALGDGEYKDLIEALKDAGYSKSGDTKKFQLERTFTPADGAGPVRIVVDFLVPANVPMKKNRPPLVDDFRVIRADGVELALSHSTSVKVEGVMPGGAQNEVTVRVASIPALLVMKGFALLGRAKQKDAYDVYYCIRNFPGGPAALAKACEPMLGIQNAIAGFNCIEAKFKTDTHIGPMWVRDFVKDSQILDGRTPDQWRQDAFGQVDAWARALRLR